MAGPLWARWVFAVLFAATGVFCLARVFVAWRAPSTTKISDGVATDTAHLLMALGMFVMFVPLPTPIPPAYWAGVIGTHSVWLCSHLFRTFRNEARDVMSLLRKAHLGTHIVAGAVMAYFFSTLPADGLSGSDQAHLSHIVESNVVFTTVGWLAAMYFVGHAMRCGIRIVVPVPVRARPRGHEPTGGVATCPAAQTDLSLGLVTALGMSYMLLTML
jgi:hypothetical protein